MTPVGAAYSAAMAKIFYSLRQYTPTEREGGPDSSKRETKV